MPGRGQANIGIWPKSSGYSRCLDITWNAKATIVTFCSDFVVRECLHSLFATTLFFQFSEENKTLIETKPSLFADTSLTNSAGLCRKIQPYGTCTSGANAVRPHEMRARNGVTISPGAYNTTISWHMSLTNGSSFCTTPLPYGTCTFEEYIVLHPHDTHTVASLAPRHGLLTERFSKAQYAVCIRHPCMRTARA